MRARRQSVFQSTKAVIETTASIFEESAGLLKDQVQVTRKLNSIEDNLEIKEASIQSVIDTATLTSEGYKQLQAIDALDMPDDIKNKLKADLLSAIS